MKSSKKPQIFLEEECIPGMGHIGGTRLIPNEEFAKSRKEEERRYHAYLSNAGKKIHSLLHSSIRRSQSKHKKTPQQSKRNT